MAKTLKDLLLALLNATLILIALCLFLGWQLAQSVEGIQDRFAESVQAVQPLQDRTQELRTELGALRSELAAIRTETSDDPESRQKLLLALTRLDQIELKMEDAQARLAKLANKPQMLIDQTITTAVDAATQRLLLIRGCGKTS